MKQKPSEIILERAKPKIAAKMPKSIPITNTELALLSAVLVMHEVLVWLDEQASEEPKP